MSGVFHTPSPPYLSLCLQSYGVELWRKSSTESNIELDMTNCDVIMTSCFNFITDKP